ncbi:MULTISPECIES: extensin family protein [unclassified Roseitalea]|uniref:extensin-like domain-containing protein n=1 Tax=unclassified Roseitalea TaxID=2639107 RepID=UPI00273DE291|nr:MULTISPECIES: extensin family protein [unclassified Roseitalea]
MRRLALAIAIVLTATAPPAMAQIAADDLPVPGEPPTRPAPSAGDADTGTGEAEAAEDDLADEDVPPLPVIAPVKGCQARLDRLRVDYERTDGVDGEGGCGFAPAYEITAIGDVELQPGGIAMRCETALALALWIRQGVIPATRGLSREARATGDGQGVTLAGIRHSQAYACRRRNNRPTGKLSHHAIGAAVDVTGFTFNGRPPIAIAPRAGDGDIEEAFQRAVRASACLSFSTVLGPGSDAYHDDHLHLDIAGRASRYRLCQ